ncbi:MAG: lysophospholipid acyltransferase family protein [Bacilli bacterium]|nr:lysophospholipid acyltransferase family protein [Bacilli bacterium]
MLGSDCLEPILYRVVRPIINILFKFFYQPTYLGLENIPKEGSVVLAGNHTNNFDCLLLISSTKRTIHFLAKDELLKGPKKVIFKNMGIIPVNRRIHDKEALIKAKEVLSQNQVIGIFPEGTFSKVKGQLLPFKIGAVKMAHDTNAKLVPFMITGTYKLLRKNITITFYPPYNVADDLGLENDKLRDFLQKELDGKKE